MSDTLKLGNLVSPDNYGKKDAVHIAVAAVEAGENLSPGTHVGFSGTGTVIHAKGVKAIGVVDPFLKLNVKKGDKFWLYLYPGSITSLAHHWTHPDFEQKVAENIKAIHPSQEWIQEYADETGVDYEELMSAAENYLRFDNYWCEGGRFESEWVPDEFWTHYKNLTGKEGSGSFFSCSC